MSKRMDASEEGLSRMSSILQDLIKDMAKLREQQEKNNADVKRLDDLITSLIERLNSLENLKDTLVGYSRTSIQNSRRFTKNVFLLK